MNKRGWLVFLAQILVVASIIFNIAGTRINNYRWEKSVESRIEAASSFAVDIIDVRREDDIFLIIEHRHSEMTEKITQATAETQYDAVEEAGQGTFIIMYVRPNRNRNRWYVYTQVICPTALYLDGNFNACEVQGPLWGELKTRNTRWAN